MADPPLSDINFNTKIAWVWTTLKTCNCILSPVRGNGLFRIHQGLYLDENLQYEISPIAKIDQPFIFIGFQGEMSAFNFLIYDWSTGLSGFKSLYFLLVVAESAKQHLYQLLQARKTEMMVIVEQLWATSTPDLGFRHPSTLFERAS